MRLLLPCLLLAALVACEDHEIFDLVSAVESSEGKGTTFYSWLGVPPTASVPEISKAYRKKSVQLHPDKNPNDKKAHERFSRLGVIAAILRSPAGRERYDFFYKNGVPKWRGTGYYYSRFRPGLGFVFVFLTILTSGLQYLVRSLNYKRDLARIDSLVSQARSQAWGAKLVPTAEGQRKVKVNLGGHSRLDEDGNVVGGKLVDMVVEGNDVYYLDPDGGLHPVNSDTATPPSLRGTWFIALLITLYGKVAKKDASASDPGDTQTNGEAYDSEDGSGTGSDVPGKRRTAGPTKGSRTAATMAGGRRRKAVKKR
ncbi:DnaJ-domain-containing protein [Fomitopsis serialis]|uniref:DnaJ-domain-containing protein n=1 Tax=Fomitopsis serialis TaxID=139415 RepID=UPI00200873F1|nr:DnaJ-domain-containing protein [Neoantrodia serialis]KAH9938172.1 DnaJ-domain-containing protein [Neoantrodia serialis]